MKATKQPLKGIKTRARFGRCDNCLKEFPIPNNVKTGKKRKRFCQANCRKEFWTNKGVSVSKLKSQVQAWVAEAFKPLQASIVELGDRLATLELKAGRKIGGKG